MIILSDNDLIVGTDINEKFHISFESSYVELDKSSSVVYSYDHDSKIPDEHKVTKFGQDMDDFIKKGGKLPNSEPASGL